MGNRTTVASRILHFNEQLARTDLTVPPDFAVINPFSGPRDEHIRQVTTAFYTRFYNDHEPRRLVLGSSPARRGTALTGVPFADAELLESESGCKIDGYSVGRGSAGFIDEVVALYGGRERFYADFVMSFVCPLGLVRTNAQRREVNANYYENKTLLQHVRPFIADMLREQLKCGIDTSVCYCIGSGENFRFLSEINNDEHFFDKIVPLEHPRFIAQYNPARKGEFVKKYVSALRG